MAVLKGAPQALGLFRPHGFGPINQIEHAPHDEIRWGLCHVLRGNWQYIRRFETWRGTYTEPHKRG